MPPKNKQPVREEQTIEELSDVESDETSPPPPEEPGASTRGDEDASDAESESEDSDYRDDQSPQKKLRLTSGRAADSASTALSVETSTSKKGAKGRGLRPKGQRAVDRTCGVPDCPSTGDKKKGTAFDKDGGVLCGHCYRRMRASNSNPNRRQPIGQRAMDRTCEHPDCRSSGDGKKGLTFDDDGGVLCRTCYNRLAKRAKRENDKSATAAGTSQDTDCGPCTQHSTACDRNRPCKACVARCKDLPVGILEHDDQRTRKRKSGGTRAHRPTDETCRTCGTHINVGQDLCAYCGTRAELGVERLIVEHNSGIPAQRARVHAELNDLAVRSWHLLNPTGPLNSDNQPDSYGENYWFHNTSRLIEALRQRGLPLTRHGESSVAGGLDNLSIIRMLQFEDALNGLLPRPSPSNASRYHAMSRAELKQLATSRGFYKGRAPGKEQKGKATEMIDFLINRDAADNEFEELDVASAETIRKMLLADMGEVEDREDSLDGITHQTHNGGMTGSLDALRSLGATLQDYHFPQRTSARGLLCGPNALVISLTSRLREMGYVEFPTMEQLMRLVFPSYGLAPLAHGRITRDQLSAEFLRWFDDTYAQNTSEGDVEASTALSNHFLNITRLRDLDYQQLIGILEAGWRASMLPQRFGLGIATSAYVRDGVLQPPLARIVWHPDTTAPVIWIHNNVNLSQGEYNHWEGFGAGEGSRPYTLLEWGMRTGDTSLAERRKFSSWDPAAQESRTARLRREMENSRNSYNVRLSKLRKMCTVCREADASECKRVEGQQHCEACDAHPEDCEWPSTAAPLPRWLRADQITDMDMQRHAIPLRETEEAEQEALARDNLPDLRPDGKHILLIGWARKSSHPGALSMQQVMRNLILSMHRYQQVLNNPADQVSPEVGNTLAGLPVQRFRVVIARHGTRRIPTQLGNLQDPMLIGFVNFIHQLLSPANVNNLPEEIHMVQLGLAGAGVDATAWGDRHQGFFRLLLDADARNHTNIAERVFIVPLVEHHVIDGVGAHCLDLGDPWYPRPGGPPSPHWYHPRNPGLSKHLTKHRLRDVVNRQLQLSTNDNYNQLVVANGGQPNPPPAYLIPGVNVDKLDRFIRALEWEAAWRNAWMPVVQGPMAGMGIMHQVVAAIVVARNNGRNNAMN